MGSSFRQFRQLLGIERELRRSEPHMAAMLAIFARLYAGEVIIGREQERPAAIRKRRVIAVLAGVIAGATAAARWVFSPIARTCTTACRQFRRAAQVPSSRTSAADNPADPRRPLGL
jgi:hypothetical protein